MKLKLWKSKLFKWRVKDWGIFVVDGERVSLGFCFDDDVMWREGWFLVLKEGDDWGRNGLKLVETRGGIGLKEVLRYVGMIELNGRSELWDMRKWICEGG
nr:hypothetical protein [Bacillus altitudinis]